MSQPSSGFIEHGFYPLSYGLVSCKNAIVDNCSRRRLWPIARAIGKTRSYTSHKRNAFGRRIRRDPLLPLLHAETTLFLFFAWFHGESLYEALEVEETAGTR